MAQAQGFYGGLSEGLLGGALVGMKLRSAYNEGRDSRRNTAMLNLEADLAGLLPFRKAVLAQMEIVDSSVHDFRIPHGSEVFMALLT